MPASLRPIIAPFVALFIVAALLLCNLAQASSLLLWPLSPWLTRKVNRICAGLWYGLLCECLERVLGLRYVITGDILPAQENAFVLSNHQAMADIPALLALAHRQGRTGDTKWFVKDPLKWVPGVGWGLVFLDCIFVKRNWIADRDRVLATFARLRESGFSFWVISFLEGTRATPAKRKRSQEFAARQGLPHLTHLLLPRTKGFVATLDGLSPRIEAVYDVTIGYVGAPPSLFRLLARTREVHLAVRRYPLASLPATSVGRAQWATDLYVAKDAAMGEFLRTGRLIAPGMGNDRSAAPSR